MRLRWLFGGFALAFGLSAQALSVAAYELITHAQITQRAFDVSGRLRSYFDDLGIKASDVFDPDQNAGQVAAFVGFRNSGTLRDWMAAGAIREDDYQRNRAFEFLGCAPPRNPPSEIDRPLNHFFDVQRGGGGLTVLPFASGIPAPDWALGRQGQGPAPTQNQFSILDARTYQLRSLGAPTREERDRNTALLFRTLGQVLHVLEDMAQPQHTRNDPHSGCVEVIAGEHSWFEDYLETRALGQRFRARGAVSPPLTLGGYDPPRFTAYQDFFTEAGRRGLADFSSRNFFSAGTNLSLFGNCGGLLEPPCRLDAYGQRDANFSFTTIRGTTLAGTVRLLLRTMQDPVTGAIAPDVAVTSRSVWDQHLETRGFFPVFSMNTLNYDSISDVLLPRAVGYSAGFLDYFFRGKLDVMVQAGIDPQVPELMQLVGKNASSEPLGGGTLTVYADDLSGNRQAVAGPILLGTVDPGTDLPTITFTPPFPPERFIAVYQGTLGNEAGTVIGKVRGGLRAESIFPDGTQRKLRAVEGVFPLPPTVDGLEAIQWGDLDNTFVGLASSTPGAGAPDQVGVFTVNRPTGSTMVPLAGGMVDASPLKALDFPFGLTLPTTLDYGLVHLGGGVLTIVEIKQTNIFKVTDPETGAGGYEPQPLVVTVSSESAPAGVIDFNQRVPIVLDRVHLLNPDTDPGPYTWRVVEVGLDAQQRPLALVEVQLTRTPGPLEEFLTVVQIDEAGNRIVAPLLPIQGRFPIDSLLMALVDVERGEVLGVTSEPLVSIRRVELHATGGFYYHTVIEFVGGDNPPPKYDRWGISSPFNDPRLFANDFPFVELGLVDEGAFGVQTLTLDGWYRGDLNPLVGPTIQTSSSTIESLGIVAVDSVAKVNYLLPERSTRFSVDNYFTFIRQGMRMRPTPTGGTPEVLLLFGIPTGVIIGEGEEAKLVRWSPQVAANTQLAFPEELPVSNYTIEFATPRGALVRAEHTSGRLTTLLFDFPTNRQTPFLDQDLAQQYVLLAPEFLYNIVDTQFHTVDASLRRTALPAPLAEAPPIPAPAAAYHLIRLP